jgi:hypothetical protein
MEKGKSRNNTLQALADYEHVKINLETNQQRFTEKGLAKFFIRNEHRILNIIPGRDSGNHQKLMKEYYRIRLHCEMITNGKDKALPCLNDKTTKTGAL